MKHLCSLPFLSFYCAAVISHRFLLIYIVWRPDWGTCGCTHFAHVRPGSGRSLEEPVETSPGIPPFVFWNLLHSTDDLFYAFTSIRFLSLALNYCNLLRSLYQFSQLLLTPEHGIHIHRHHCLAWLLLIIKYQSHFNIINNVLYLYNYKKTSIDAQHSCADHCYN